MGKTCQNSGRWGRQAACSSLHDQPGSSGRAQASFHPVALVLHLPLWPKLVWPKPATAISISVTAMHGTVTQSYEWGWCINGYIENSKTLNFESQKKMQNIPCICMQAHKYVSAYRSMCLKFPKVMLNTHMLIDMYGQFLGEECVLEFVNSGWLWRGTLLFI